MPKTPAPKKTSRKATAKKKRRPVPGDVVTCPKCEGTGMMKAASYGSNPGGEIGGRSDMTCETCQGSGKARYVGGDKYQPVAK